MAEDHSKAGLPRVRRRAEGRGDTTVTHDGVLRRILNVDLRRFATAFERRRKWLKRWRVPHPDGHRFAVFVVGSNRSGTQMVCEAIGRSPHGWDYQESEANLVFKDYQLRSAWVVRTLIRMSPAPIVSFGNILDAQITDHLLDRFEGSKAIWVYRRHADAVNSSVRKWGDHLRDDMVRWVAQGQPERLGPRGKRISAETASTIAATYRDGISAADGASLYWFMRNRLYFDLGLDRDSRVLLVQYEEAVDAPESAFRRIFDFLGFPYHESVIDNVFSTSVGKDPAPHLDARVRELCDELQARLDKQYRNAL